MIAHYESDVPAVKEDVMVKFRFFFGRRGYFSWYVFIVFIEVLSGFPRAKGIHVFHLIINIVINWPDPKLGV